jgi:dTDP-4-dehydrorhamnose 3,5-epimerase
MKVTPTPLSGVLIIEPDVYKDSRGFFLESYHQEKYAALGITNAFVQDNHSRSMRGTLRGLHAQLKRPQGKLIRVLGGEIFDVMVDIRRGSPTYKQWYSVTLSAENFLQCYVPVGYAHGFYVLSEVAEVEYKCTALYDPTDELGLLWNDPDIGVQWPEGPRILSTKDQKGRPFSQLEKELPVFK